jgi:hypothetical protein
MQRWIAGILAVFNLSNGLAMLFASSTWWVSVPGVPDTGPFNPHFVEDVGAAFLVAGVALAARAWRPAYWSAALAGDRRRKDRRDLYGAQPGQAAPRTGSDGKTDILKRML